MKRFRGKPAVLVLLVILFLILAASIRLQDPSRAQDQDTNLSRQSRSFSAAPALHSSDAPAGERVSGRPGSPTETRSRRIANYDLHVRLDEKEHRLTGRGTVVWRHPGTRAVREVYFHLYPNAFESKKTTFMRESGGKLREDRMTENSYGHMRLKSVTMNGRDLSARADYVRPDDGNPHDRTLLRITLPEPVAPGEQATFQISFEVKLPYVFARMGYAGDFVMAGQWFPKICAYETKGMRGPEGRRLEPSSISRKLRILRQFRHIPGLPSTFPPGTRSPPRGFARNPRRRKAPERSTGSRPGTCTISPGRRPRILSRLKRPLHFPDSRTCSCGCIWTRLTGICATAMWRRRGGLCFNTVHGSVLTHTLSCPSWVPPAEANGAGGMEYPTLVTAWGAEEEHPGFELERVVVHEIGHQYFYGILANNEFEEAWLDEAFTSYAEDRVMAEAYGVSSHTGIESAYVTGPAPLKKDAWTFGNHGRYADNVYIRGKLVLKEIENRIGTEMMNRVLRTYYDEWKFRHPGTEDFLRVLEDVTGEKWGGFFRTFVHGDGMTDYAVSAIRSEPVLRNGKRIFRHEVMVEKHGAAVPEVPLALRFENGERLTKVLNGEHARIRLIVLHASPIRSAVIDPQYRMFLENRRINNTLRADVGKPEQIRWNLAAVSLLEMLVRGLAW